MMTGYELSERMRKMRRRYPLTATEQALYNELVAICNEDQWPEVFPCSNDELCSALRITGNTLDKARQTLIQGGLVFYKSGKSKRQFGKYSFVKELTISNNEVKGDTNAATNKGTNIGTNKGVNGANYNKTETKPNTKSKSHSGADAPADNKPKTEYWKNLVAAWFGFYSQRFKKEDGITPAKPIFNKAQGESLKMIIGYLKSISLEAKREWTEEYAVYCLRGFLQKGFDHDNWLRTNFELGNLLSKFNSITNSTKNNGNDSQPIRTANNRQTGATKLAASLAANLGGGPTTP